MNSGSPASQKGEFCDWIANAHWSATHQKERCFLHQLNQRRQLPRSSSSRRKIYDDHHHPKWRTVASTWWIETTRHKLPPTFPGEVAVRLDVPYHSKYRLNLWIFLQLSNAVNVQWGRQKADDVFECSFRRKEFRRCSEEEISVESTVQIGGNSRQQSADEFKHLSILWTDDCEHISTSIDTYTDESFRRQKFGRTCRWWRKNNLIRYDDKCKRISNCLNWVVVVNLILSACLAMTYFLFEPRD